MNTKFRKQKRDNRYNINLNDDESQLFEIVAKFTGVNTGTILRQLAVKQAIVTLIADDIAEEFNLEHLLKKGAQEHLSGS